MRTRILVSLALSAALASPAFASFGGKPEPPSNPPSSGDPGEMRDDAQTPRQQAERWYGDAYDDVAKAKEQLAKGKDKDAEKKFKRALERATNAVQLDSTYAEAWNLIGFASRKLGDYPKSLAAYGTCLRLKPDFAAAREYYGEALAENGDLAGAREQLALLKQANATDLAAQLDAAIAAKAGAKTDTASGGGTQ